MSNLIQKVLPENICSLLIFRSHSQKSIARSNCFVQMMSAQYLLTPLLESCLTWYSWCPTENPYWFSGHIIKGQGQTADLCSIVRSISLDSFAENFSKFGTVDAPWKLMTPIDFHLTLSKMKAKLPVFEKNIARSIFKISIAW